ncbi:MAG: hypothetical protein M1828_000424 [Chrysothrix sp. TS-e1954]|nr:MAG: hypothetical protein M1828_000424 [Chrysothrix sp. TS-e1954]
MDIAYSRRRRFDHHDFSDQQLRDTSSGEKTKPETSLQKPRVNLQSFRRNREIPFITYISLQRKTERLSQVIANFAPFNPVKKNVEIESSLSNPRLACVTTQIDITAKDQANRTSIVDCKWQAPRTESLPAHIKPRHVEIVIPEFAQPILPSASNPRNINTFTTFPSSQLASSRSSDHLSKKDPIATPVDPHSSRAYEGLPTRAATRRFLSPEQRASLIMAERQPSPAKAEVASPDNSFAMASPEPSHSQAIDGPAANLQSSASSGGGPALSSLVGAVHKTTGKAPPALVGASTTISGDKLYVFGGRRLSKRRTHLTQDMYELDLIQRHWTKITTTGLLPAPRYFHSLCALGGTKLICYGGMAPALQPLDATTETGQRTDGQGAEPGIIVMSDVHIYDISTKSWMAIPATNTPPGRYAHCATILPSHGVFTSKTAPMSSMKHGSTASAPVTVDGRGGAEMVIVGGQDGASRYIEQISVFNLRSLRWTATETLGKSCGAYRSVVAPLIGIRPTQLGTLPVGKFDTVDSSSAEDGEGADSGFPTLIYSNYNFLDVKLEMQIRLPDGTLTEKTMNGDHSPPGLRFPSGDIIDNHFLVSGTFLTSSKQEYALWALDLRNFAWSRIDAGPGVLTTGSWNRGLLWRRRNTFVILGDRRRRLADDYNHRRLNFTNMCTVELEAFGLYDNPAGGGPWSGLNAPSPQANDRMSRTPLGDLGSSTAAQNLGRAAAELKEGTDMDILAIGGERVAVNSHLIARRWGPYFGNLLEHSAGPHENGDTSSTLRLDPANVTYRMSSATITPESRTSFGSSTLQNSNSSRKPSVVTSTTSSEAVVNGEAHTPPTSRSRLLYLPHTYYTIRSLVYFLYTSTLPPPGSSLCTPQILCSLLQIARPYRINGLLEATVKRLHQVLDGRNTAAIFNAAAMAAGGGDDVAFEGDLPTGRRRPSQPSSSGIRARSGSGAGAGVGVRPMRMESLAQSPRRDIEDSEDDALSSASASTTSLSVASESDADGGGRERRDATEIWGGDFSAVIGLQKRGLRGLMEGRRLREQTPGESAAATSNATQQRPPADGTNVGLGIAP